MCSRRSTFGFSTNLVSPAGTGAGFAVTLGFTGSGLGTVVGGGDGWTSAGFGSGIGVSIDCARRSASGCAGAAGSTSGAGAAAVAAGGDGATGAGVGDDMATGGTARERDSPAALNAPSVASDLGHS
jgi:hypothetical protein